MRLSNRNAISCPKCGRWIKVASRGRASLISAVVGGLSYATTLWILYSSFSSVAVISLLLVLVFAFYSVNLLRLEVGEAPRAPIIPWSTDTVRATVTRSHQALTYFIGACFVILGIILLEGGSLLVSLGLAPTSSDPLSIAEFSNALTTFNLILEAISVPIFMTLCYLICRVGSHLKISALQLSGLLGIGFQVVILALTPVAVQTQTGYELLYPMNVMYFLHFNNLLVVAFDALGAGFVLTFAIGSLIVNQKTNIDECTVAGVLSLISVFLFLVFPFGLIVFGFALVATGISFGKIRKLSSRANTNNQKEK